MEVTTVKLQMTTKSALDKFRMDSESYDSTIRRLLSAIRHKSLKKDLIEAYQNMGNADVELLREWDFASSEVK